MVIETGFLFSLSHAPSHSLSLSLSASPTNIFFGNGLVTSRLWTTLLTWQFPSIRHSPFFLPLHFGLWSRGFDLTFFIASLDNLFYIVFRTIVFRTVASFNCIAVEMFAKFMFFGKMFCYKLKEYLSNVSWNRFFKL